MTLFGPTYRLKVMPVGTAVAVALLAFLLPVNVAAQAYSVESLIERAQQAGADAELMQAVATRAERSGLSPEQTAEILSPAVTLAERDLPSRPVLNKTLEGVAKQVPPSRMMSVLQNVQTSTEQAGTVVSSWLNRSDVRQFTEEEAPSQRARSELITSVTEAQQQHVPAENIEQFLQDLPGAVERRPVSLSEVSAAVSVLPDLPESARTSAVGHELLAAALDAGYDGESIRQLPAALSSARQGSDQPAKAIARATALAIQNDAPAASVLTNLLQGSLPGRGAPPEVANGPLDAVPGQGKPPGKEGKPPGVGMGDNLGDWTPDDPPTGPPS